MPKKYFLLLLMFLFSVYAANADSEREDIWISVSGETAFYGVSNLAFGGGFAFGYGTGSSLGIKAAWLANAEEIETLELSFLLRFYLLGASFYSGPFLQAVGGASLFNPLGKTSIPSYSGSFSAGICFGWRFIFKEIFFAEPFIRTGYPYILGAGVSAGVRF